MLTQYDFVPWNTFLTSHFRWNQGEHIIVIGRTGNGKTTLLSQIIPQREYKVMFVTKVHDDTITTHFKGWDILREWNPKRHHRNILLWPESSGSLREIRERQRAVFQDALDKIFKDRGWTVVLDEAHWMSNQLGLAEDMAMYQHQARSSYLTVINGVQRPSNIPVITYGSATHAFLGRQNEPSDLRRLSGLGGVDSRELSQNLLTLPKFEWVYVDNVTHGRAPIRTRVDLSR
jgi:ABC-type cobalamin/Fe3+-siderophores transport system ATPase subunit